MPGFDSICFYFEPCFFPIQRTRPPHRFDVFVSSIIFQYKLKLKLSDGTRNRDLTTSVCGRLGTIMFFSESFELSWTCLGSIMDIYWNCHRPIFVIYLTIFSSILYEYYNWLVIELHMIYIFIRPILLHYCYSHGSILDISINLIRPISHLYKKYTAFIT